MRKDSDNEVAYEEDESEAIARVLPLRNVLALEGAVGSLRVVGGQKII